MERFRTLPQLLLYIAATYDKELQFAYPRGGEWLTYSTQDLFERVRNLALGLVDRGVRRGDTVGLIAQSSPDWVMIDLAIQIAGGVTVPIFNRISRESFVHEVKDSGMKLLFIGDPNEVPMAHEEGKKRANVVTFSYSGTHEEFDKLLTRGAVLAEEDSELFRSLAGRIQEEDLATIIYTSGSTGLPKGVELTQRNIVSQIHDTHEVFKLHTSEDRCLSVLPLAHIFERTVMYFYMSEGLPVYFVDDHNKLGSYVVEVQPTTMTVVPRILEKVHAKMADRAAQYTGLKRKLAEAAMDRAKGKPVAGETPDETGKDKTGPRWRPMDLLYERLVYPQLRAGLGGQLRHAICGSAKLEPALARFFWNIGVPVYEGYGLTEAAPVIAANCPSQWKVGSVGKVYPSVEVELESDGEILARGPNIMRGYHNSKKATEETLSPEGWLHTGDLGTFDEDGYLRITGRRKEIFKKSTGEYVPPEPIERDLRRFPIVDTAVVIADNRNAVTALLFPEWEKVEAYKKKHGLGNMSDEAFLQSEFLRQQIQKHIDEVNKHHHHCEWVVDFRIVPEEASVDHGELTPTLKLRRFHIEEVYRDTIEEMYEEIGVAT